jgi:hypothetical protein
VEQNHQGGQGTQGAVAPKKKIRPIKLLEECKVINLACLSSCVY